MDYQGTDEVTRRQACEKVKQIAKSIIKIRKKYYLCFSQISLDDQKRYDELKMQMENVAKENGLEKLNAQLMSDINTQYDESKPEKNENPSHKTMEDWYQKFMNALAMQAELTVLAYKAMDTNLELANSYLKKARMCQNRAKEYGQFLGKIYTTIKLSSDRLTVFRDKFGEITQGYMPDLLKLCHDQFSSKNPQTSKIITDLMNKLSQEKSEKGLTGKNGSTEIVIY